MWSKPLACRVRQMTLVFPNARIQPSCSHPSQDFSVKWSSEVKAHLLLDKRGGLKRVLARRESGGADDWVLGLEKRVTRMNRVLCHVLMS